MPTLVSDVQRTSAWLKHVLEPTLGVCTDKINLQQAGAGTYVTGTVVSRTLTSGALAGTNATGNTGNGTVGTTSVNANTVEVGTYKAKMTTAGATAAFTVFSPAGVAVGTGLVGTAYTSSTINFTVTTGGTNYAIGDVINLVVTGVPTWSTVGDLNVGKLAIVMYDTAGEDPVVLAAATPKAVVALVIGRAIVSKTALVLGASIDSDTKKAAIYAQLESQGILCYETV